MASYTSLNVPTMLIFQNWGLAHRSPVLHNFRLFQRPKVACFFIYKSSSRLNLVGSHCWWSFPKVNDSSQFLKKYLNHNIETHRRSWLPTVPDEYQLKVRRLDFYFDSINISGLFMAVNNIGASSCFGSCKDSFLKTIAMHTALKVIYSGIVGWTSK